MTCLGILNDYCNLKQEQGFFQDFPQWRGKSAFNIFGGGGTIFLGKFHLIFRLACSNKYKCLHGLASYNRKKLFTDEDDQD